MKISTRNIIIGDLVAAIATMWFIIATVALILAM